MSGMGGVLHRHMGTLWLVHMQAFFFCWEWKAARTVLGSRVGSRKIVSLFVDWQGFMHIILVNSACKVCRKYAHF